MTETTEEQRAPFEPNDEPDGGTAADNGEPASRKDRKRAKAEAKEQRKADKAFEKEEKAHAKAEKKAGKRKGKGKSEDDQPEQSDVPQAPPRDFRRIGHKGADSIVKGNTVESFEAGVEHGAEIIEFDVLRTREGRLVIAHDAHDASMRRPLSLPAALDAFCQPPLDEVEINLDLKLPGREAELAGAIAGHGLSDRTAISTMEVESLVKLRSIDPDLRLGWTIPKTRRDWTRDRWARPALGAGLALLRRRMPKMIVERAPELDIDAVWSYHQLITPEVVEAAGQAEVELIAWTVDEPERVAELAAMGVDGIVSNDPRILT
jgi:glycerophosphoryl diester phosphodiesterase